MNSGALIVGAGPAGCAAALALADGGACATLIERTRETGDAICGGFMSWRTLAALRSVGFDPDTLGGHPIDTVRLFAGKRIAEAPLPAGAIGVSRHRLDTLMQAAAVARGIGFERGVDVRSIEGTRARLANGASLEPEALFLGVGKHDVRGAARPRDDEDPTLGLRLRLPAHPRLTALVGGAIELHLFDRAYVGVVLQEDGSANVCLATRKSRLAEAGGRPEALLAEFARGHPLADRLAFADGRAVDAIGSVPYGWRTAETVPGLFRLGDQAAVIPSLAGEGIGIAIASGIAAAKAYADGGTGASTRYQADFARRTRRPVAVARALWHAAESARLPRIALPLVAQFPALARLAAHATRVGQ